MAADAALVERFETAKQGADLATDRSISASPSRRCTGLVDRIGPRLRATYRARRDG
jgi:DNA-binding transcriptional MocR family regulator